jgi:hypothetical protein
MAEIDRLGFGIVKSKENCWGVRAGEIGGWVDREAEEEGEETEVKGGGEGKGAEGRESCGDGLNRIGFVTSRVEEKAIFR